MAELGQMITAWLIISGLLTTIGLCISGLAYLDEDRSGTASCLKATALAWTWPVGIPALILHGIWKMTRFAFPRERRER